MKDCWHFMTKDRFIFTTRGDMHPPGLILSAGVYCPDENGDRTYKGVRYSKKIDEYGEEWIKQKHPEYVVKNESGNRILVPSGEIERYFNPFDIPDKTRKVMKETKWGGLMKIIEELVPKGDIGFIGSYLMGFPTENSDVDMIIRGMENLKRVRENFDYVLNKLNARDNLDEDLTRISLEKYYNLYSNEKNDFSRMIENRWPTIRTPEYMTKLRFVPKDKEVNFPKMEDRLKEIEISGKVVDDIGTNFMPRFFMVKSDDREYTVMTYFWDYTYCVVNGDKIKISGRLFKDDVVAINDRTKHGIIFN